MHVPGLEGPHRGTAHICAHQQPPAPTQAVVKTVGGTHVSGHTVGRAMFLPTSSHLLQVQGSDLEVVMLAYEQVKTLLRQLLDSSKHRSRGDQGSPANAICSLAS